VRRALAIAVVLVAQAARAQSAGGGGASPDGGAPPATPDGGVSEAEIARALAADAAAQKKSQPAPAPTTPAPSQSAWSSVGRFIQSLNPDVSAIVDFAAGYYSRDDSTVKAGDDPGHTGFNVQEVELALQAVVDPYFRADVFLTIPNLGGLEVEEAFLTTTHLPWNFQLKAGIFRAGLGRQNAQHLHLQDFTRRPALNTYLLGVDGLRAPGLELNWLVPRIPFYLLLAFSAFSVEPPDPDQVLQTFGGGSRTDFAYVATARAFFPLNDATSIYLGLNYAHGKTAQRATSNTDLPSTGVTISQIAPTVYDNWYDNLYGADLYLKWKPPNVAQGYASVAWQSEYFLRQIPNLKIAGVPHKQLEGAIYSQLVVQAARRWFVGVRGEILGIPAGDNVKREYAAAASLTWALSEFARARIYGEVRFPRGAATNGAAFLQLEAAIGAHGAHPF
jgi:hypothetical protein